MIYFIAAYPRVLLQQLCITSRLRSMYTECRLVLRAEEHNIPCLSAVFFHFYASRFRIIIFSRPIMLNFCSFPANSRHNAAYYPLILRALFSSSYSNFLRIFLSIHTFSSPYCSENRFPPFLRKLQNLRLIGIILKRPFSSHRKPPEHPTKFGQISSEDIFPNHFISVPFRTIRTYFPPISAHSEQKRPKARFRTLGPDWFFW